MYICKYERKEQKEWKIILYEDDAGVCPIEDYMSSLSEEDEEKIDKMYRIFEYCWHWIKKTTRRLFA